MLRELPKAFVLFHFVPSHLANQLTYSKLSKKPVPLVSFFQSGTSDAFKDLLFHTHTCLYKKFEIAPLYPRGF